MAEPEWTYSPRWHEGTLEYTGAGALHLPEFIPDQWQHEGVRIEHRKIVGLTAGEALEVYRTYIGRYGAWDGVGEMRFLPPVLWPEATAREPGWGFSARHPHMRGWATTTGRNGRVTLAYDGGHFPDADLRLVVPDGLLGPSARVSRRRATGLSEGEALALLGCLAARPDMWALPDDASVVSRAETKPAPSPAPAQ